jgi:hypothetical protein
MEYEVPSAYGTEGRMGGGQSVLIAGPAGTGKRALVWETLLTGRKGGAVLVSTTDPVSRLGFDFRTVDPDEPEVQAVDASGDGAEYATDEYGRVEVADGPGDFTGIGVGLTRQLGEFDTPNPHRRVGLDSLAPLLDRVDRKSVFKFLHTLDSRADAMGWLLLVTLDTDAVAEKDRWLAEAAFDRIVETRRTDGYELRTVAEGTDEANSEWRAWEPSLDL